MSTQTTTTDAASGADREKKRIPLSPGFHAEPGETPGHLHDVYTTVPPLGDNRRIHVGTLSKAAVDAWAAVEQGRVAALGRLAGARAALTTGAAR
ncbi:hypothetical protein [Methylobacterium brachiatum]|uniref:hypothetical protein n=1 Tax=Methylobacterium brachiatum TaxID=269660 RepID=UPI0008E92978|nr:hypothetical protein [Methylobacterium brachiatum]SFJ68472.1 hypothetical protein SAMN02799642_05170 [Methylobacterium brachiatum]